MYKCSENRRNRYSLSEKQQILYNPEMIGEHVIKK